MSGPLTTVDVPAIQAEPDAASPPCVELFESRAATVGGIPVRRALPKRRRRTVGAWCFVDHIGPVALTGDRQVEVGPHPHIGLQTVTWLLRGEQVHRDSLGTEQLIRPGQLNLMTAGNGVVHAEESEGYRGEATGVQLWVAQPDHTRHGAAAFEHHEGLPEVALPTMTATVLLGALEGQVSPGRTDTPLVGLDLDGRAGTSLLPLRPDFEYALIVLEGETEVCDRVLSPGEMGYIGLGRDGLAVSALGPFRAILLGGEPFREPIFMWWNFVARTREEIEVARREWSAAGDRFQGVASPLPRMKAPVLPWRTAAAS